MSQYDEVLLARYHDEWLDECLKLLRQGVSKVQLRLRLLDAGCPTLQLVDEVLYPKAMGMLKEAYMVSKVTMVGLHLERYGQQLERMLTVNPLTGDPKKDRIIKVYAFMKALQVMRQKERLFGLHTPAKLIKKHAELEKTAVKKEKKPEVDFSVLSLEERVDFLALFKKASTANQENEQLAVRRKEKEKILAETVVADEVITPTPAELIKEDLPEVPTPTKAYVDVLKRLAEVDREQAKEAFEKVSQENLQNTETFTASQLLQLKR